MLPKDKSLGWDVVKQVFTGSFSFSLINCHCHGRGTARRNMKMAEQVGEENQ